jgi:hypothetical protein
MKRSPDCREQPSSGERIGFTEKAFKQVEHIPSLQEILSVTNWPLGRVIYISIRVACPVPSRVWVNFV